MNIIYYINFYKLPNVPKFMENLTFKKIKATKIKSYKTTNLNKALTH